MKKIQSYSIMLLVISVSLMAFGACTYLNNHNRPLVILSTNDMHAQIEKMPALATAIKECRDTAEVILVDAGDKWTGNAFVDLIDRHTPIYELMNELRYDVGILGNHEFDWGQAYLCDANRQANFEILGANIISDTTSFSQPAPTCIIERNGIKIGFVGVTGNYDSNNHPAGKDESFVGIHFVDPQECAAEYASLKNDGCDVLILITHMGLDRDREFAASELSKGYDMIIGGHSHDLVNERVNGVLLGQTANRLKNIGATVVELDSDGKAKLTYRNIPLEDYAKDQKVQAMVDSYHNNPVLNAKIGAAAETFTTEGLRNLFADVIRRKVNANIGVYHSGGVRLEEIQKGDISVAKILNMEPFSSTIVSMNMTTAQLKAMIMAKFNDKVNVGESHYIDLNATTPYTVLTNENGDAVDVVFPELKDDKLYKVAMGDYIYKTYKGLECSSVNETEILITKVLEDYISSVESIAPDNVSRQAIAKQ